jgi:hypothetical protein
MKAEGGRVKLKAGKEIISGRKSGMYFLPEKNRRGG